MKKSLPIIMLFTALVANVEAVDIQQLVQDTQRFNQDARVTKMVWWIPVEFWEATLEQDPGLTEEQKKEWLFVRSCEAGGKVAKKRHDFERRTLRKAAGVERAVEGLRSDA